MAEFRDTAPLRSKNKTNLLNMLDIKMLRHIFKRREISRTTVSIEHDRSAKIIIIINSIYVSGYLAYKLIDDATKTDTDQNKMLKMINIVMKLYL